jgi:hypothetical protein
VSLVLIVETTHGIKTRIPLEFRKGDTTVSLGVLFRIINPETEAHVASLSFYDNKLRLLVGAALEEVWTNVPPHPFAGMSADAALNELRPHPAPTEEELEQSDRAATDPDTLDVLIDTLTEEP